MTFSHSGVQSFPTAVYSFQEFEPTFGDEVLSSIGHCRASSKMRKICYAIHHLYRFLLKLFRVSPIRCFSHRQISVLVDLPKHRCPSFSTYIRLCASCLDTQDVSHLYWCHPKASSYQFNSNHWLDGCNAGNLGNTVWHAAPSRCHDISWWLCGQAAD